MTNAFAEPAVALAGGGRMPLLGFGTWQMRGREARRAVGWAFEAGYRHVDTATIYGNEQQVGAALRESGLSRDAVFLTTKAPPNAADRALPTLRRSLDALGVDAVDLWLVHWPPRGDAGLLMWRAFVWAREEGLARSIGVSNYSLTQLDALRAATGVMPEVNQIRWSPLLFDGAVLDGSRPRGVAVEGYSPFKGGSLAHPTVVQIAARHGRTPAQVVVRWHLQHEVVVIPKSSHEDRIVANADVFDFSLTPAEMVALDGLSR